MKRISLLLLLAMAAVSFAQQIKKLFCFWLTDLCQAQASGYDGDPNVRTANLDMLTTEGLTFTNAVSIMPVCTTYRGMMRRRKISMPLHRRFVYIRM